MAYDKNLMSFEQKKKQILKKRNQVNQAQSIDKYSIQFSSTLNFN